VNTLPTDVSPHPLSWMPYLSDNAVRCVHWIRLAFSAAVHL